MDNDQSKAAPEATQPSAPTEESPAADFGSNAATQEGMEEAAAPPSETELLDTLMKDAAVFGMVHGWKEGMAEHMTLKAEQLALKQAEYAQLDDEYQPEDWSQHYFNKGNSADWFFAVGGKSTWTDGWYTWEPRGDGTGTLSMDISLYLFDRYNWDGSKSVNLLDQLPVTLPEGISSMAEINDEDLGALHKKGLAKEFEIYGDTYRQISIQYDTNREVSGDVQEEAESGAGQLEGGRVDPGRETS